MFSLVPFLDSLSLSSLFLILYTPPTLSLSLSLFVCSFNNFSPLFIQHSSNSILLLVVVGESVSCSLSLFFDVVMGWDFWKHIILIILWWPKIKFHKSMITPINTLKEKNPFSIFWTRVFFSPVFSLFFLFFEWFHFLGFLKKEIVEERWWEHKRNTMNEKKEQQNYLINIFFYF